MKIIKKVLIGIAVCFFLILAVGFVLPSEYRVERSVLVDASPQQVYEKVHNLKAWPQWAVWFERDTGMQVEYGGTDGEVGMTSQWQSETQGNGEMEVTLLDPPKRMIYQLRFVDYGIESTGEFVISREGDKTRVTWADYGDVGANPINHYFAALMDSMVGPDLEEGLQGLKALVEQD